MTELLEDLLRGIRVHLQQVEVVGVQAAQALLDAREDVLLGVDVGAAAVLARFGLPVHRAPALACEEVLVAASRDVASDELLAGAVVDRGVDEVDAEVEDGVEHLSGVLLGYLAASWSAAQLHGSVTEDRYVHSRAAQRSFL